jgi:hypothetical protein
MRGFAVEGLRVKVEGRFGNVFGRGVVSNVGIVG